METLQHYKTLKKALVLLLVSSLLMVGYVQAGMMPTSALIDAQGESYTQADLRDALASEELKEQLQAMGVDVDQLNDRVASLTPSEIQQLNSELESQPAGGVVGVLLTIFIVFVVTDMLCATDVFTFVRCINK